MVGKIEREGKKNDIPCSVEWCVQMSFLRHGI